MINVFIDNFVHQDSQRTAELEECIICNMRNPHINFVRMNSNIRMTYQNFIDFINEKTSEDDVNVIANADIIFDDTVKILNNITNEHFVALSRRELQSDGTSIPLAEYVAKWSQDVWAWRGKSRIFGADFYLGILGCDNRIAYEAKNTGYKVINPSYAVFAHHNHLSGIHNADYQSEKILGKKYYVFPQYL
jgi:hypothetical protein